MTSKKVKVDVKVDERQAVKAWDNYAKAAKRGSGANEKFSGSADDVRKGLDKSIVGMRSYVQTAIDAAKTVDALSQRAIQYGDAMNNLPFSIDRAARATNGMITQFDLAKGAIQANRLGVSKTGDEYARLVKVAATLARTQGTDVKKGVEDFTNAIARGSPRILDNLGIIVKQGEANRAYARAIGKTVDKLTEAEKKEAFKVMALKKGEDAIHGARVATDGWAVSMQKAKTAAEDLGNSLLNIDKNFQDLIRETDHLVDRLVNAKKETNAASKAWDFAKESMANGLASMVGYNRGLANQIDLHNKVNESMERGITLRSVLESFGDDQAFLADQDRARKDRLIAADTVQSDIEAMNKRNKALEADARARQAFAFDRERIAKEQESAIAAKRSRDKSGEKAEKKRLEAAKQRFEETRNLQLEEVRLYEEMGGRVLEANDRRLEAELQFNLSMQAITTDRTELAKLQAEEELLLLQNSHDRKIHLRQTEIEANARFDEEVELAREAAEERREYFRKRTEERANRVAKEREKAHKQELKREQMILRQRMAGIRALNSMMSEGASAALLFGDAYIKNEERRAKFENRARGAQAIGSATLDSVKSYSAFATGNIPQGAALAASAAFGFAKGGLLMSGQLDPSSGGGESPASGASPPGGGSAGAGSSNRGAETGEIPLSVQEAQRGRAPANSGGGTTFAGNITIIGEPSDDDIDRIVRRMNERGRTIDLEAL